MTSPRRRQDRPIRSVALKIVFRAGKDARAKIRQVEPSAKFRQGSCEVRIDGDHPAEVAEKARAILETIRTAG